MSFNIVQMMKQAKEMQARMQEIQQRAGEMEVEGAAGGGAVRIVMNCKGEVRHVTLDPSVVRPEEKEILEDLVKAACNAARAAADARINDETRQMMEGLGLPAGTKLPF